MKTVSKFKNIIFYKQRATLISGCSKKEELCCAIVTRGRILAFVECARSGSIKGSTNRLLSCYYALTYYSAANALTKWPQNINGLHLDFRDEFANLCPRLRRSAITLSYALSPACFSTRVRPSQSSFTAWRPLTIIDVQCTRYMSRLHARGSVVYG